MKAWAERILSSSEGRSEQSTDTEQSTSQSPCVNAIDITIDNSSPSRDEWIAEQKADAFCRQCYDTAKSNADDKFVINNGLVYWKTVLAKTRAAQLNPFRFLRLVLPATKLDEVLIDSHDEPHAGHMGVARTWNRVSSRFYRPGLKRAVNQYIRTCPVCQRVKPRPGKKPGLLQPTFASKPWEVVSIDLFGPVVRSKRGCRYVFVAVDKFSRWVEFYPIGKATAANVQRCLNDLIHRFGTMGCIHSDNAKTFVADIFENACKSFKIYHRKISPYHAQANRAERTMTELKRTLQSYVDELTHEDWDKYLPQLALALRTSVVRSTGFTPSQLFLGRQIPQPLDWTLAPVSADHPATFDDAVDQQTQLMNEIYSLVDKQQRAAAQAWVKQYNKTHRPVVYQKGEKVLILAHPLSSAVDFRSSKLGRPWKGPYVIKHQVGKSTYALMTLDGKDIGHRHVMDMKKYFEATPPPRQD